MEEDDFALPAHFEEIVRVTERMRSEHHDRATPLERLIERATALIGRPAFFGSLTILVISWICANLFLQWRGWRAFDAPPFPWLEGVLTLTALYIAALILTTQRRADQLAGHREQMTLQLALLGEQKSAKIIALMEELRRDSPEVRNRVDVEAQAMASPTDAQAVSEAVARDFQPQSSEITG